VRFCEATNAKHRVVSHELITFCGSCYLPGLAWTPHQQIASPSEARAYA
jgi:hypothetical protein